MTILVTGAAGFIGMRVCQELLARGQEVVGVDSFTPYYDVKLKRDRLSLLQARRGFSFCELDVRDHERLGGLLRERLIVRAVHLAAQPGVRYSLTHPFTYSESNLTGHLAVLEAVRHREGFEHLVYASSSSVYGGNRKLPFSVEDAVDTPVSLYAATKRAGELMSQCYAHLYGTPQTGLRFFTVYGPWYRPDMALWLFTKAILAGEPVRVFNHGDMRRDFTWIDDVVSGVLAALDRPPSAGGVLGGAPHAIYNVGNHVSEPLLRVLDLLEAALGRKAERVLEPMQDGDVRETFADIDATRRALAWEPTTPIDVGIPRFAAWYREYHGC